MPVDPDSPISTCLFTFQNRLISIGVGIISCCERPYQKPKDKQSIQSLLFNPQFERISHQKKNFSKNLLFCFQVSSTDILQN